MSVDFSIAVMDEPSEELVEFLESVHFGGEGLRYRRTRLARSLGALPSSTWLLLRDAKQLIRGSYLLETTPSTLGEHRVESVYRGLLAIDPALRRQGHGKRLVESAFEQIESGSAGQPTLSWGLIERENIASRRLLESFGASEVGAVESRLIYRQWPKQSGGLAKLEGRALHEYEMALGNATAPSGLSLTAPVALPAFGLLRYERVTAAARVSRSSIDLGAGGPIARFLHRHAYSRFRAIGKRYDRRAFTWLGIHDPLVLPDHEGDWQEFIAGLLAAHDVHMALFTLDPASRASAILQDAGVFGPFARATRQELRVVASGWNLPEAWQETIRARAITGGPVL